MIKMKDLIQFQNEVAEHLGIDPLPIRFEDIGDEDSRLYFFMRKHIVINSKYKDNYIECAKCITHEYRHYFQSDFANHFDNEIANRWRMLLNSQVNAGNMNFDGSDYISQELEIDAFAFTKYYLKKYEGIDVKNKIEGLDEFLDEYIEKRKAIL